MNELKGTVFNIQRYSLDDGPGIRTTVFMKGCPLKCLWCSNPESQNHWPEIMYRDSVCKKCGTCARVCEVKAITVDQSGIQLNRDLCTRCMKCVESCPAEALRISGREMTVEEVMRVIKRDIDFYKDSKGGVTASGGEILSQADFVAALFKRCRDEDIHTCADTSGYGDPVALKKIIEYTCLFSFDLKHMDSMTHKNIIGTTNELILKNLKTAVASGIPVVVRFPVIPDYNDSNENIRALAETVAGLPVKTRVHLLPYHKYGANKYKMLGRRYQLDSVKRPSNERLQEIKEMIESCGAECKIII